jgi:hypothetical protein
MSRFWNSRPVRLPRTRICLNGAVVTLLSITEELTLSRCPRFSAVFFPRSTSRCDPSCFESVLWDWWNCQSEIVFESSSSLLAFDPSAFASFRVLRSICIPSSVESIGRNCFTSCVHLSIVTFERDSRLSVLSHSVFESCSALESVRRPPSIGLTQSKASNHIVSPAAAAF